jgi:hypothetical protein
MDPDESTTKITSLPVLSRYTFSLKSLFLRIRDRPPPFPPACLLISLRLA